MARLCKVPGHPDNSRQCCDICRGWHLHDCIYLGFVYIETLVKLVCEYVCGLFYLVRGSSIQWHVSVMPSCWHHGYVLPPQLCLRTRCTIISPATTSTPSSPSASSCARRCAHLLPSLSQITFTTVATERRITS